MKDRDQNNVFNVNFGLYDFGYLKYQENMGKLLVKKKQLLKRKKILDEKFAVSANSVLDK